MNIVTEAVGRYLSIPSTNFWSGFLNPRLVPNRDDDGSKTVCMYNTPTVFKLSESYSAKSYRIDTPSIFYSDDLSRDSMQAATGNRLHLGSVVYDDGIAHHEYNGVYHAKCDGTIKYQPQLDKADSLPNPGNPLNVNPFTGSSSDRVIFIAPGMSLYETASNKGWNTVDKRYYHEMHIAHMAGLWPVSSEWYVLYELTICANMVSDTLNPLADSDSSCWARLACLPMCKSPLSWFPERWLTLGYSFSATDMSSAFTQWVSRSGRVPSDVFSKRSRQGVFDSFMQLADQSLVQAFVVDTYKNSSSSSARGFADYRFTASNANVDKEELTRQFGTLTSRLETELLNASFDRHVDWSDLSYRACQDVGMWNGNGIQYIADITHLTADTKRLIKTLKSLSGALKGKKLKAACKAASAAYLSIHYGIKLSVIDTAELARVISSPNCDFGRKRCQAAETFVAIDRNNGNSWNVSARYQLMYNTKKSMDHLFREYLRMLDVVPDLANIWDALPYSFCIDWFIKVGDLLESIDNYTQVCSSYDVEAAGRSTKYTRMLNPSELGIPASGEISFSLYTRGYSRNAVVPIPSKLTTSTNPFTHSVEAGALLVSK